ncbi:MAG TPA: hypothetical protein VK133_02035 [Amoebophilaceae bacterium]|nr:hypothetical protein [Amoebophilaceae bacterium]
MKVKITLLGLFVVNTITKLPTHAKADEDRFVLEKKEEWSIKQEIDSEEKEEDSEPAVVHIGGDVVMTPNVLIKEGRWSPHNDVKAILGFKTIIPEALYEHDAKIQVAMLFDRKEIKLKAAKAMLAKFVTIGYGGSIFEFEKANPALLVTPVANVLQLKFENTFYDEQFKFGYALESPVELKLGRFDKNYVAPAAGNNPEDTKQKSVVNQIDDTKDTQRTFKARNNIPTVGLSLGAVTDELHVVLSGLGRLAYYTHSTDPTLRSEDLPIKQHFTYGANLGGQYKVVPKKVTLAVQGCFVDGLGDYISGLGSIQADGQRKEMSAVYYTDAQTDSLTNIKALGAGATVEFCATKEWTLSVAGSYLGTLEDTQKPGSAFRYAFNLIPKLTYNLNKHLSFSGGWAFKREEKVEEAPSSEGMDHKPFGVIKFSF